MQLTLDFQDQEPSQEPEDRRKYAVKCKTCTGYTSNAGGACTRCLDGGSLPVTLPYCNCAGCGIELVGESKRWYWNRRSKKWRDLNPIVHCRINDRPYCAICAGEETAPRLCSEPCTVPGCNHEATHYSREPEARYCQTHALWLRDKVVLHVIGEEECGCEVCLSGVKERRVGAIPAFVVPVPRKFLAD